jgi:predicted nucleic acid-binding protein
MEDLTIGVDTSCLVPLMSSWHRHHEPTIQCLEDFKRRKCRLIVATHAVLECFSVLTRLPDSLRIAPREAYQHMQENLAANFGIVAVDADACWLTMDEISTRGLRGGLIYDAIIARCCAQAGASILLTWNVQDFVRVAPPGLAVRDPLS